jgi:transcriptional regulator with XRE-family HTH domain
MQTSDVTQQPVGVILRRWRERRRLSQLQLAMQAEISARHLSFIETSRSKPSRDMIVHLSEQLEVPLRERNHMLLAAGYAPAYPQSPLGSPAMAPIRSVIERMLQTPHPTAIVDRRWNLVEMNAAMAIFTEGLDAELFEPPVNLLRVALHPRALAPRIVNFSEWSSHLLDRLRREARFSGDAELIALYDELRGYAGGDDAGPADVPGSDIATTLRIRSHDRELAFFSTIATFGSPVDVTVAELMVETLFPADAQTAQVMSLLTPRAPGVANPADAPAL